MPEIAKNHHADARWDAVVRRIAGEVAQRGVHPCAVVVLVPYAQLMPIGRHAWMRAASNAEAPAAFIPRFETTHNWSRSLGRFNATGDDLRLDAATDVLIAASLLRRSGLASQQRRLAGKLMETAWSLARLAAAVPPLERAAWGQHMADQLGVPDATSPLQLEVWLGRIALAWAAGSVYATDCLFNAPVDLLVLLQGFQTEPLLESLRNQHAQRCLWLPLDVPATQGSVALHAANDAEDEAERAAACVLQHLAAGRSPVALVAQDRFLVRRVRAMLDERGVVLRDETGWTLSTTRSAANVMGLLRAMAWNASGDAVLDWLKNAPAFDPHAVALLEASMRRRGVRDWRGVELEPGLTETVSGLQQGMQAARPIGQWLHDLRVLLQQCGHWQALLADPAGHALLDAVCLRESAAENFAAYPERLTLSAFQTWLTQVLEAGSFVPPHPVDAQVVILPLTQLLGRSPAALVFPGADEERFPACAEPAGDWSPAQRELLGLPSRAQLRAVNRAAWFSALRLPCVDILWRTSHNGEAVASSALVQELLLAGPYPRPRDPRSRRTLSTRLEHMPGPSAAVLTVDALSASGYADLRSCPYRFFALRQLQLREADELDVALGKRDFGLWLHAALRNFQEALTAAPTADEGARLTLMDAAAAQATRDQGLSVAEFLPFASTWPRIRQAYLAWLAGHEGEGVVFVEAEAAHELPLGSLRLQGRIDRIDRTRDGRALVIDYKTEARKTTVARVRAGSEDVQLPFYAALLSDDTLDAMYLHIGETSPTEPLRQPDIVALRDALVQGVQDDLQRIAAGAPLPALGNGTACDYCAARGLCRKDHWANGAPAAASHG